MSPQTDPSVLKDLMFGRDEVKRFTQDSPVMPDVWLDYGKNPGARLDLLLTPYNPATAGELARTVRERLEKERQTGHWQSIHGKDADADVDVAYNQSTVGACLSFDELVRVLLPLSSWWQTYVCPESEADLLRLFEDGNRNRLARALEDPERGSRDLQDLMQEQVTRRHLPDLLWMFRVVGALAVAQRGNPLFVTSHPPRPPASGQTPGQTPEPPPAPPPTPDTAGKRKRRRPDEPVPPEEPAPPFYRRLIDAVADLLDELAPFEPAKPVLYSVNRNRPASLAVARSALAVKADAARLLFSVSCRDLAWAVIDSGIDARHPAFRKRKPPVSSPPPPASVPADEQIFKEPFLDKDGKEAANTRVVATYDFTRIRNLLNPSKLELAQLPETLRKRYDAGDEEAVRFVEEDLPDLKRHLQRGREINWDLLKPLLEVPHVEGIYHAPGSDHGTHVAGILAADWRAGDEGRPGKAATLQGICPDLNVYDFRVLDDAGKGDEFAVIAALQFVRHLNAHKDELAVHGTNLSLSMYHDVSNYACGATPVCEECERLVGAGVVVVAAAGNLGWRKRESLDSGPAEGYSPISITDPGNADGVITVGATHRFMPHTYGVSYFSSRGPTGDGRCKPDLVAPGEKIEAPVPGGESRLKDGTSMAAPHVSGVAALLLARHRELAGKPRRIKQILCDTATDLGRERYFQGAGMVDALRALQSV